MREPFRLPLFFALYYEGAKCVDVVAARVAPTGGPAGSALFMF
jgi:hypothetical protein